MKFILLCIISVFVFTSCGPEEEPPPGQKTSDSKGETLSDEGVISPADISTEITQLNLQNVHSYTEQALTYLESGNYKKAIEYYTNLIAFNPKEGKYYFGRATTHNQVKKYQRAIDDFTEAIKLDPENKTYYIGRSRAFIGLGKHTEAHRNSPIFQGS